MSKPASSQRPHVLWYAGAAFATLAPFVFLALPKQPALVWFHLVCLGATLVAAIAVHRSSAQLKWPWWCFVASLAIFSVRDVAMNWVVGADISGSVVNVVDAVPMLFGYVLLCSATIKLVQVRSSGRDHDGLIDAAVVACAVATIVWISIATSRHPGGVDDYFITAAHAILQALLIALAVRFMFTDAGRLAPAWLLFGATFFAFIGNVGAVIATDSVQIAPHNWIAATWIAAWCCVPLAAGHPRMREIASATNHRDNVPTPRLIVLGAAMIGTPAVVLTQSVASTVERAAGVGSLVVTLLVLVRVFRLVRLLDRVRVQQQTVAQLGQLALRGERAEDLFAAAEAALATGLHGASARVELSPAALLHDAPGLSRTIAIGDEIIGVIRVVPARAATAAEDAAFVNSVASTLSSALARSRAEDQVRHWAMHDPLTSLANRVLFADRLEQACARSRRTGDRIALLFIDIDSFKLVNDELGHDVGDAVLVETARRLAATVRSTDSVARLAGDEFVVLSDSMIDEAEIQSLTERLLDALRAPIDAAISVPISASIGVAFSNGDEPADALIKRADNAMYAAKRAGRDRAEFAQIA